MHRAGADLDDAVLFADAGQTGDACNVDQRRRLIQPQFHQRHQTVAAGNQLTGAAGRGQLGQGVVDRGRACVVECGRDHD